MIDPDARTRIRIDGCGLELHSGGDMKRSSLNPTSSSPTRLGLRYHLEMSTLGKLERLAKARFDLGQLTDEDLTKWVEDDDSRTVLAQSVIASSEIEGEGVAAEEVPLLLCAVTTPSGHNEITKELDTRKRAIRSIYLAALWALLRDVSSFITYDFVLELHERMFNSTLGDVAGRIKARGIEIRGGGYEIKTLPHDRASEFLNILCERTNRTLQEIQVKKRDGSMLLTVAEFVSDFLAIHPFEDGNGRTARLLSTYLLERCGYHFARFYPVDNIILETRSEYYSALYESQKCWYLPDEDMSSWIAYYVRVVAEQYERAYTKVRNKYNR